MLIRVQEHRRSPRSIKFFAPGWRAASPLSHERTHVPSDEVATFHAGRPRCYARHVGVRIAVVAAISVTSLACGDANGPASPSTASPTVRVLFLGPTTRRSDLPPSAGPCVNGVGATHIHPSWRSFAGIPLQPVPPDRYEIVFMDVPVDTRVSFRVNDQNACDENPTGAVTRNIFVNEIRLIQNTTTPGNGDEPGFAFMVARDGRITQ